MTSIIMLLLLLIVIIIFVVIFRKSTALGFSVIGIVLLIGYFASMNQTTKEHYDNGQLKSEMKFKSGELASAKLYHENGQLSLEGDYRDNMRNGLWMQYDNEGQLEAKLMFRDNLFYGRIEWYYKNGQLKELGYWAGRGSDSYRDNDHKWWFADGKIKAERNYDYGYEETQECWDEAGREIECNDVFFVYNIEKGLTDNIPSILRERSMKKSMEEINKSIEEMEKMNQTMNQTMENLSKHKKIIPNKK
ncbi:MAG: hypothetical protein H8E16_08240 [Flavobacteriales bacterium]|nr:hypothetical protein [Flavobacteriales bacterium]